MKRLQFIIRFKLIKIEYLKLCAVETRGDCSNAGKFHGQGNTLRMMKRIEKRTVAGNRNTSLDLILPRLDGEPVIHLAVRWTL